MVEIYIKYILNIVFSSDMPNDFTLRQKLHVRTSYISIHIVSCTHL